MTNVISGATASLVSLTTSDNPTTITSTGLLQAGLYAPGLGSPWSITNAGTVLGAGGNYNGAGSANGVGGAGGDVNSGSGGGGGAGGAGVAFTGGGTLINAGAILGADGADAVNFDTGAARLILDPGASFSGNVVADPAFTNVLELASGTTPGTLSGVGTQYTGFTQTTIDAGASWTITGTDTFGAGSDITNYGSLTLVGATADALVNDGGIVLDPSNLTVASLTGTGSVTIEAGSTELKDVTEAVLPAVSAPDEAMAAAVGPMPANWDVARPRTVTDAIAASPVPTSGMRNVSMTLIQPGSSFKLDSRT